MTDAIQTNLAVGCGLAKGEDARATGAEAARQAVSNLADQPLSAVLVFASARYDLAAVLQGIQSVVDEAPVLGATTAGEICCGPQQESVVVVALASPYLKVHVGLGQQVSGDWQRAVAQATTTPELRPFFSPQDRTIWQELTRQGKSAFALLFSPGNTRQADSRSYEILEELKRLSAGLLPIIGGSAADDWQMDRNYVLWGQQAYPDSLLVAVFETQLRFGAALAHGFQPSSRRATVTRAQGHEVLALDGQPAAEMYARLLGSQPETLAGKHLTLTTGRPAGSPDPYGQYSINVASYFTSQGGVRFSQPLPEGTTLTMMEVEPDHLITAGAEALRKALLRGQVSEPALVLVFSCALRVPLLGQRQGEEIARIGELVPGVPVAGFYSFGEQGLADDGVNRHNNEVIALLVLGRQLSYAAQVALENEQLRQELQESEARFRLMYERAPLPYQSLDAAGCLLEVNQAWLELLNYARGEVIGRWFGDFLTLPSVELFREKFSQFKTVGRVAEVEFEVVRRDGSSRLVSLDGTVGYDGQGRFKQTHCVLTDITERRQTEEALRESKEQFQTLLAATESFIQFPVGQPNYQMLTDELLKLSGARYVVFNIYHESGTKFTNTAISSGIASDLRRAIKILGFDLVGKEWPVDPNRVKAIKGGKLTRFADLRELAAGAIPNQVLLLLQKTFGLGEAVVIEITHAGQTIGDFILLMPAGQTVQNPHLVQLYAEQAGLVLMRSQAERALQAMEQRYRNLFQDAPVLYIVTRNHEGVPIITDCNRTFLNTLGYQRAEVLGRSLADFYTPESRRHLLEEGGYRRALAGRLVTEERQLLAGDGRIVKTMLHAAPESDADGRVIGTRGIFMDITDRVQAEAKLRRLTEQLQGIMQFSPSLISIFDLEGRYLLVNSAFEPVLGLPVEEIIGKTFADLLPPDVVQAFTQRMKQLAETKAPLQVEDRLPVGNSARVYSTTLFPLLDAQGRHYANGGISLEITERVQAEEDLRRRTAQLEALREVGLELTAQLDLADLLRSIVTRAIELVGGTGGGLYFYRPDKNGLEWTVAVGAYMAPLGTVLRRGEGLSGKVWESGRPLLVDDYQHWVGRAAVYEGYPFTAVVAVPVYWGQEFLGVLTVIAESPYTFSSADAELLNMFAAQAASAIHNARLVSSLRESEKRYSSVVDNVKEVIFQTDAAGLWTFLNPAWAEITGFPVDESLGTNFINYVHPDDRQRNWELFQPLIEHQKDYCRHEIRYLTRDGGFRWIEVFARLTLTADDTVLGTSGTLNDITERKQMEEALSQRAVELSTLLEASRAISSTLDLNEVLLIIAQQMVRAIGVSGCTLSRWDREAEAIVTWAEWRQAGFEKTEASGSVYALRHFPLTRKVLETGQPVTLLTTDPEADPAEVAHLRQNQLVSLLMLPLAAGDQVLGLCELDDKNERNFTETDLSLCQALAEQATVAIQQARLYEQTRQHAETRAMLLQEVNHRVKNNLAAIVGLLYARQRRASPEAQPVHRAILADLIRQVQGLATVHDMLSATAWAPLRLSDLVSRVTQASLQVLPPDKRLSVDVTPSPVRVTARQANSLALVTNELVTNSIKHALSGQDTGRITVRIALEGEAVLLEYRDDGPGYPEQVLQLERHNVGLYLIQTIVRDDLQGELALYNEAGAVTRLRFKAMVTEQS